METSIDFLNPQHIQHKTAENPIFGPMFLSPLEQPCFHLRCLNVNTATMQPLLPDEVFIIFRLGVAGRSCRELLPIVHLLTACRHRNAKGSTTVLLINSEIRSNLRYAKKKKNPPLSACMQQKHEKASLQGDETGLIKCLPLNKQIFV